MIQTNYLTEEDLDRVRIARDEDGRPHITVYERPKDEVLQRQIPSVANMLVDEFGVPVDVELAQGAMIDDGLTAEARYQALRKILVG
ncbi:MAG: hypothetical protein HYU56_02300 [Candidatus Aenigmarchaeota archaeon]|nr:hypothetical protein [Candidatus Aenigmarchaeota archaeon]